MNKVPPSSNSLDVIIWATALAGNKMSVFFQLHDSKNSIDGLSQVELGFLSVCVGMS